MFFWQKFLKSPWGHGRPRLRVLDVRAEMLVFQDFEGLTEVFAPGRPPGHPCGCPAPKLTLWAAFSFLNARTCSHTCQGGLVWATTWVCQAVKNSLRWDSYHCDWNSYQINSENNFSGNEIGMQQEINSGNHSSCQKFPVSRVYWGQTRLCVPKEMFSLERMKFLQYPAVGSLTCIQALQMTGQGQKSLEESQLFLLPLLLLPLPPPLSLLCA